VNLFTVAAGVFAARVSASMAKWSARLGNDRRLSMNVQEAAGIRERTAQEIDHVTGGAVDSEVVFFLTWSAGVGALVGGLVMGLID
jgi:hypothetical protein